METKLMSSSSGMSLSVNYLPTKFSNSMLNQGTARRRARKKGDGGMKVAKMGGGVDAFRSGEARMPVEGDDDYDGVNLTQGGWFKNMKYMKWTKFKWTLFFANVILTTYTLIGLIVCLLTWFNIWDKADIIRVGNHPELVISTLAVSIGLFTSIIGWAGILLNNRSFLAVYNLFLWITFAILMAPGYLAYKRHSFNLEGKINAQWSRDLGADGRLKIQNLLQCCGYFSPFIEATVSQTCYARSVLPGCKLHYLLFERMVLRKWYTVVFVLAPVHVGIIIVALLCSNHVTYRFGKGMMPKAYRLSANSMAVIMDQYTSQLAEHYGHDVAMEVVGKAQFEGLPVMDYAGSNSPSLRKVEVSQM
ncbi:hypothetical protein AGABI2DRAFT_74007 [Agaricus bisporus var. bisporus H97]|uniref:hypothetical protein n=1 Tax=Agaricus bisporus var. bisporus (strain H97 / ATCC MYA-4626 / FGSC 10389) TaxID=936046 RepID=UPI00029F5568|nr:hypothetical protein AGABI2DRAFT_74007 [Agaricus bisporus var. bisporus H97]EKV45425.1 hypothetical protein AGABI2DRAFT_74007 [Agaricus bisporus var. bisporus H97]